jgi:hypothetical protein
MSRGMAVPAMVSEVVVRLLLITGGTPVPQKPCEDKCLVAWPPRPWFLK